MTAGHLVVAMMAELEKRELPAVYLRNYECLPDEVGNDVDLLVPAGQREKSANIFVDVADRHGWSYLGRRHFSPLALYFANIATCEILHIDLFDRIEWHFIEFAHAPGILARRRFNGLIHIPSAEDEIYLNLATRLAYQGIIRKKHQDQAENQVKEHGDVSLAHTFACHMGQSGESFARELRKHQWQPQPGMRSSLIFTSMVNHGLRRPLRVWIGMIRYIHRCLRKTMSPPGCFIVFEGADGVGKSTVIAKILPWCSKWCSGRDTHVFHWKPIRFSNTAANPPLSVDPRGSTPRPTPFSLLYLAYHLLGFWWGWAFKILPLMMRCHCVVGDRYSHDLFLDPARFRLKLPDFLCSLAARLAPRPDLTVALLADPEIVHARKPELTVAEISSYQDRWSILSRSRPSMIGVPADGPPEEVVRRVKQAILKYLVGHGK